MFFYLLPLRMRYPDRGLRELVAVGLNRMRRWYEEVDLQAIAGLNIALPESVAFSVDEDHILLIEALTKYIGTVLA